MATDYAEKERVFIAALSDDTGTDLAGWIARIINSALTERNDIIDWLRQQGFSFAKASWIERIHHNGGRLIYAGDHSGDVGLAPSAAALANPGAGRARATAARGPVLPLNGSEPSRDRDGVGPPNGRAAALAFDLNAKTPDGVAGILAGAKGLRPLAEVLLAEIVRGGPVETSADAAMLKFSAPKPFAALLPGPKELRFYGDFGDAAGGRIKRAEPLQRLSTPFPQVIVLNDVRQIDEDLRNFISAARERANGQVA